jgi:hypothetical protein
MSKTHRLVDYANQSSHRASVETLQTINDSRAKSRGDPRSANTVSDIDANHVLHSILEMQSKNPVVVKIKYCIHDYSNLRSPQQPLKKAKEDSI